MLPGTTYVTVYVVRGKTRRSQFEGRAETPEEESEQMEAVLAAAEVAGNEVLGIEFTYEPHKREG